MQDVEQRKEDQLNRRTAIALVSVASIAAGWTKPVIRSIVTPAHAQMSCSNLTDLDVLGRWNFTDQNNNSVEIEFVDATNLIFDNRPVSDPWRIFSDGTLFLDMFNPAAAWRGTVTQETDCVGSEITLTVVPAVGRPFTPPMVGVRV